MASGVVTGPVNSCTVKTVAHTEKREDRVVDFDLAIVGSGFGGSILAMIARRLGFRVMLLERGQHPRFAIGESASPLAGILIEQLSDRYELPRLRPLSAFGTWQRSYPHVVCGLKRGFTYFKHETGRRYHAADDRVNQLLVAASPSDELSDTHWLRSDVDHFLVNEAIALGVEYRDLADLERLDWQPNGDPVLVGSRAGRRFVVRARFVVDASGPRGFLSRVLAIDNRGFGGYPETQALFSHFTDVARCEDMPDFEPDPRALAPSHPRTLAPYPIDDAALHHVFDGGWMWVLRFGNGVTSAGVAAEDSLAEDLKLAEGEPAWRRLLARYPSIAAQFADARPIRSFTWMPRLAYRAAQAAGERWAMLPSAAAFIDPLFSTGIPLTLLGIERLAGLLKENPRGLMPALYANATLDDADRTARFIAGSYAGFHHFPMFAAYSMFYFAAASYSEMARRLASPRTPGGFLCGDSDAFAGALDRLSPARGGTVDLDCYEREVASAVADWNIAGLCDRSKKNWYGVDLEDTVRDAAKLGLGPAQVRLGLAGVSIA
jgi:tetracycline 7-halogenase / FADH2 O2-dependent halogenase